MQQSHVPHGGNISSLSGGATSSHGGGGLKKSQNFENMQPLLNNNPQYNRDASISPTLM
jgi:hypothetical protein